MSRRPVTSPEDQRATFIELFFDLVFVFSVTQVVGLLHNGVSWAAAGRSVLVFWLIWWAWTQFTWALNAADTDHPAIQLSVVLATAVAFFMAVGVPDAIGGDAMWFAVPYVLVRVVGLVVYAWVAASQPSQRVAVRVFGLASIAGLVAVLVGASVGGNARYWIWAGAIVLDVLAAAIGGRQEGWDLHPEHFAERHGLIVIIALGESLIVAAAGLAGAPRTTELIAVAALAVGITCGLWWTYFPHVRPRLEAALAAMPTERRGALARDAFSLAHFPMLCGVIGLAAVIEESIAHPDHALPLSSRATLAAGVGLFVGGAALAKWRALRVFPAARVAIVAAMAIVVLGVDDVAPWVHLVFAAAAVVTVASSEHVAVQRGRGSPDTVNV